MVRCDFRYVLLALNQYRAKFGPNIWNVSSREVQSKTNVSFAQNDTLLRYTAGKTYIFDRNLSIGDESDKFTTVNFPALVLKYELIAKLVLLAIFWRNLIDSCV